MDLDKTEAKEMPKLNKGSHSEESKVWLHPQEEKRDMSENLSVTKVETHRPRLGEVVSVLQKGLCDTFTNVDVSVVDCPNLTKAPFHLSSEGLCGNQRIADIGGPAHLIPVAQTDKVYHFKKIAELSELPNAFLIGAGAGPCHVVGVNSELMNNVKYTTNGDVINNAYTAKIDIETGGCVLEKSKSEEFCLMGNFLICDGRPGKVIEVKASKRHGSDDFVASLRKTLQNHYGDKVVGIGGVFLVEKGSAHLHIMPDFQKEPFKNHDEVENWLKYFDMDPTLVCVGELVSHDPGLDLRVEHFHCFSMHGQGGHYHWDTTPDEVEYRGYFVVVDYLYRIDQPTKE